MSMCNMCAYSATIGNSFVWLQLISSYHGVSTAKCRVRATDRGHLMMSDDFGSKSNDEKARQEAVTILWRSRRWLASFSRRDLLRTPGLAEKYLLELLGRCSSHCDACNRQVGEPVESNRFACTATPLPRACTRVLVRSHCSFWVCQSWCCCLAVRSGAMGKDPPAPSE